MQISHAKTIAIIDRQRVRVGQLADCDGPAAKRLLRATRALSLQYRCDQKSGNGAE